MRRPPQVVPMVVEGATASVVIGALAALRDARAAVVKAEAALLAVQRAATTPVYFRRDGARGALRPDAARDSLTIKQAAHMAGVSTETMRRWLVARTDLGMLVGGRWSVSRTMLAAFLAARPAGALRVDSGAS